MNFYLLVVVFLRKIFNFCEKEDRSIEYSFPTVIFFMVNEVAFFAVFDYKPGVLVYIAANIAVAAETFFS